MFNHVLYFLLKTITNFSVGGPIDPTVVKSLCGQIEKLTSMLVKVDEDIDDLDERTEENRHQVDGIRLGSLLSHNC